MVSIRKEFEVKVPACAAWSALRDFHAVHERLAPGFVTHCQPDGEARIVTFANGAKAREMLVDADDARRRLVYAISNEKLVHYNAAIEVIALGADRCRLSWTVDLLPHSVAGYIDGQMEAAAAVMRATLESAGAEQRREDCIPPVSV